MPAQPYVKSNPEAPEGYVAAEAAGLRWLAAADAVPVVEVLEERPDALVLERLEPASPTREHARRFGEQLARLHDAGAEAFGQAPSEKAWFGPLEAPFPVPTTPRADHGMFWGADRLGPLLEMVSPRLDHEDQQLLDRAVGVITEGAAAGIAGGAAEPVSRLHGDLWAGNVLWTAQGATLIDPAAHGGHRLEDLAMLMLFGAPYLEDILAGYEQAHPLPSGWEEDIPAHQLFGLLAHVHLFGAAYLAPTLSAADAVIRRAV